MIITFLSIIYKNWKLALTRSQRLGQNCFVSKMWPAVSTVTNIREYRISVTTRWEKSCLAGHTGDIYYRYHILMIDLRNISPHTTHLAISASVYYLSQFLISFVIIRLFPDILCIFKKLVSLIQKGEFLRVGGFEILMKPGQLIPLQVVISVNSSKFSYCCRVLNSCRV